MEPQGNKIILKTIKKTKTPDTDKISYCILTYNIQKHIFIEGPARTGLDQWLSIFQGKIFHPHDILPDLKDGDFDIIHITLTPQNLHLINCVREKIGEKSRTKIVVFNEYPAELLQYPYNHQDTFKRELHGADVIACTHEFASQALKELLERNIYTIPYPANIDRIRSYRPVHKLDIITIVFNEFSLNGDYPVLPFNKNEVRFLLYNSDYNKLSQNRTKPAIPILCCHNYFEYCKYLMESQLIYQQEAYHNCGKVIIDAAILGIPVVGSIYSSSMQHCFPQTAISSNDLKKAQMLITRLKSDKEFYKAVSEYAKEKAENYSRENSIKRLFRALYNETADKRFALVDNKKPVRFAFKNDKQAEEFASKNIKLVHGTEIIKYNADEFVVICLVRNGAPYINEFINHYHNLGAKHFYFIDNCSTDNTCLLIKQHSDVSIFSTDLSFKEYECAIRRVMIRKLCKKRWCLCIDIDEFFDFPYSDILSISQFINYLNQNNFTVVIAHMLEIFSKQAFSALNKKKNATFKELYCYYDISQIQSMDYPVKRFECRFNKLSDPQMKIFYGGIRKSVFGGASKFFLVKHPLMFIDENIIPFTHPHFCNKAYIADITCLIHHYKFISSFPQRVSSIVEEDRYPLWANFEYNMYHKFFKRNTDYCFYSENAKKLNSINDLIENGFVSVSGNYLDYISSFK